MVQLQHIFKQIEDRIFFVIDENTTLETLDTRRNDLEFMNEKSVEAMKKSGYFAPEEVKEVAKFAASILFKVHFNAVKELIEIRRANWVF